MFAVVVSLGTAAVASETQEHDTNPTPGINRVGHATPIGISTLLHAQDILHNLAALG